MKEFVFLMICSYLLGAIPFAFIIGKAHGVDLRQVGSGNIGATNLSRAIGKKWGYFCFSLDVIKGLTPTLATAILWTGSKHTATDMLLWLAIGACAIIGHVFPVYIGFRGGKGVATGLGVALGIYPYCTWPGVAAFAIWVICALVWRYISLASIIAAAAFPLLLCAFIIILDRWRFSVLWPTLLAAAALAGLVIFRHRSNISRLLAGAESKIKTPLTK